MLEKDRMENIVKYRSLYPWKFQLIEPYQIKTNIIPQCLLQTEFITLNLDGVLDVAKYYAWDGATDAFDTKDFIRGSLVHDALCTLCELNLLDPKIYRPQADLLLRKILLEDKMLKFRVWYVYLAVSLYTKYLQIFSKHTSLLPS